MRNRIEQIGSKARQFVSSKEGQIFLMSFAGGLLVSFGVHQAGMSQLIADFPVHIGLYKPQTIQDYIGPGFSRTARAMVEVSLDLTLGFYPGYSFTEMSARKFMIWKDN